MTESGDRERAELVGALAAAMAAHERSTRELLAAGARLGLSGTAVARILGEGGDVKAAIRRELDRPWDPPPDPRFEPTAEEDEIGPRKNSFVGCAGSAVAAAVGLLVLLLAVSLIVRACFG